MSPGFRYIHATVFLPPAVVCLLTDADLANGFTYCSTNAFPIASSALIDFKNYPLGVSSFVYYVSRFIGQWEPVMLCAQGLLIFGCFYAIFGIISEKKRFLLYAFLGLGCATLSLFNLTIRINNLLVDFLLPVLTLAVFAIAHQYRTDAKRALLTALPLLALLTITKNTGILFAALGMAFLVYTAYPPRGAFRTQADREHYCHNTACRFTLYSMVHIYECLL